MAKKQKFKVTVIGRQTNVYFICDSITGLRRIKNFIKYNYLTYPGYDFTKVSIKKLV